MVVKGKVVEETKLDNRQSSYIIVSEDELVEVVAHGKQALKDAIFIRNGQNVEVDGELREHVLISQKERIIL